MTSVPSSSLASRIANKLFKFVASYRIVVDRLGVELGVSIQRRSGVVLGRGTRSGIGMWFRQVPSV